MKYLDFKIRFSIYCVLHKLEVLQQTVLIKACVIG